MSSFILPKVSDTVSGWGPAGLSAQFADIPYAPYSKADKLGRIADWSAPEGTQGKDNRGGAGDQRGGRAGFRNFRDNYVPFGSNAANAFNYQHTEDEASFSVVDNRSGAQKKITGFKSASGQRGGRGGFRQQGGQQRGTFQRLGANRGGFGGARQQQGGQRGGRRGYNNWRDFDRNQRVRDASVKVGAEWNMLEEIEFSRLNKLQFEVNDPEDIALHGAVATYDKAYDRVNTKQEKILQQVDRERDNVTTSEDPILSNLASQPAAENEQRVFATDSIISVLMTASRSVYPWDIVINRTADKVVFDTREGSQVDYVSVNENSSDPPMDTGDKDNINSPSALSLEATYINTNFAAQVVNGEQVVDLANPNPFYGAEEESVPLVGYRYRKFDLSTIEEEEISLFVRTEVDAVVKSASGEDSYITLKALNEFDTRAQGAGGAMEWRQKLDSQRGAVVATEMKNNSCKLARWVVQSMLAGADHLKLGFVSRTNPKDPARHAILGTQICRPKEFASQMNLQITNGWGIVKTVVDLALKLPEGKYVLVKDPNKPVIRLYSVPKDTFEEAEEENEEAEAETA
ncbi:translation initiation factor 3 subunit D [Entomortierella parvispora]|uniref:Eukaryotic translation initiation factor 3 subunit D n=1 Tax=Entomortierella parvispora TaxID=205924 RepID=A0A9P3H1U8_9FUNG|nr:translation initiation factor 3 subunit D [Entomortierella parvispora]